MSKTQRRFNRMNGSTQRKIDGIVAIWRKQDERTDKNRARLQELWYLELIRRARP